MSPLVPVALAATAALVAVGVPGRAAKRLSDLGAPASPTSVPLPVLGAIVGLLLAGPVAGVLGAAAGLVLRRTTAARAGAADRSNERATVLDALTLLAADLRSGRTPADALTAAAEVASGTTRRALTDAALAAARGSDVAVALGAGESAAPEVLRGLAACWSVCATAGSGLAAGVDRLQEGLRAAETQRRAVEAELAGPRATAGLLAVLPVAGLGLAAALGAHPVGVLLHTRFGLACLVVGLGLDAAGLAWTRRLVSAASPA
jgi:tight adherence protein B